MSETRPRTIRVERLEDGKILRITLDAGKGNVLTSQLISEMRDSLGIARNSPSLRALVIDHEGKDFSFGASVDEHMPDRVADMLRAFHSLARELLELHVPIIAAVSGNCLGGGLELACLADRVIASQDAKLGQPEINLGVFAPIGSALLLRKISSMAAANLLLSGRIINAEEAHRIGLVAGISQSPGEAAMNWVCVHLLPKSASSLHFATQAARRTWVDAFFADLEYLETLYLEELMVTHDAVEGITAFLEKRDPVWQDR